MVFYFKSWKTQTYIYSGAELQKELLVTSIIMGITVTVISNIFTKRDLKKQKIERQDGKHFISKLIPSKKPLRVIYATVFSFLATYIVTVAVIYLSKEVNFYLANSLIVIFLISAFASVLTAYMNIVKTAYESEK